MITPGEYIQILEYFGKSENWDIIRKYSALSNLHIIEGCKRFDELRELHNKYKKECDHYKVYPNYNLDKMNMLIDDIKRITEEFKIRVEFVTNGTVEYKDGIHANYFYNYQKITPLIVFNKKREKSQVSH